MVFYISCEKKHAVGRPGYEAEFHVQGVWVSYSYRERECVLISGLKNFRSICHREHLSSLVARISTHIRSSVCLALSLRITLFCSPQWKHLHFQHSISYKWTVSSYFNVCTLTLLYNCCSLVLSQNVHVRHLYAHSNSFLLILTYWTGCMQNLEYVHL